MDEFTTNDWEKSEEFISDLARAPKLVLQMMLETVQQGTAICFDEWIFSTDPTIGCLIMDGIYRHDRERFNSVRHGGDSALSAATTFYMSRGAPEYIQEEDGSETHLSSILESIQESFDDWANATAGARNYDLLDDVQRAALAGMIEALLAGDHESFIEEKTNRVEAR